MFCLYACSIVFLVFVVCSFVKFNWVSFIYRPIHYFALGSAEKNTIMAGVEMRRKQMVASRLRGENCK